MIQKLQKIFQSYKISILIPVLIILSAFAVNFLLIVIDFRFSKTFLHQNLLIEDAKVIQNTIQQQIEYFYESGNLENVSKVIKNFSPHPLIEEINLINPHGVIIASSRNRNLDSFFQTTPESYGCKLKENKISCISPIFIKGEENGQIAVIFNTEKFESQIINFLALRYLIHLLIILGSSFLLMFFLNQMITKNLNTISNHLDNLVRGQYIRPIKIEGNNEFAIISEKLNKTGRRLWELINFDYLTRIPNRYLIVRTFGEFKDKNQNRIFIGIIDIDNFKEINDFFGHNTGDYLLMEFAERLMNLAKEKGIFVGRLGGDEFLILGEYSEQRHLENTLNSVKENLEGVYSLIDSNVRVSVSIGVYLVNQRDSFYDAMKRSDMALYRSKNMGKGKITFYTEDMVRNEERRKEILNYISLAISNGEFYLVFQPIVDVERDEIYAYEALLRWNNPKLGEVSPAEFIPMIEKTGMIIEVGKYVFKEAISSQRILKKPIHINLSLVQLFDPQIVEFIREECKKQRINYGDVTIELIETQEIFKLQEIRDNINKLKFHGFYVSLDDFGTGFSNIELLEKIDPDSIKIDMSLTKDIVNDIPHRHIVLSIVKMAEVLGIRVIAEGVDSKEKKEVLRELGIRYMQGYYLGKPNRLDYYINRENASKQ